MQFQVFDSNHLNDVIKDSTNISNVEVRSYVAKELPGKPIVEYTASTRESLLMGPEVLLRLNRYGMVIDYSQV